MATGIYLIDNPPTIRQYRSPRRASPSGVIVVHTAESFADESPPDRGAENVAAFIQRRTNYGSYHDLADSDSLVQLIRYSDEAFHDATGSNPHSYGVSAACQAAKWPEYPQAWRNATVTNMARGAARYARWLKARSGIVIPARRVSRAESENRKPGFISHAERDPTRRTDPGKTFPWTFFLAQYNTLLLNGDDDMPTPEEFATAVWNHPHRDPRAPADAADITKGVLLDRMRKDTAKAAAGVVNVVSLSAAIVDALGGNADAAVIRTVLREELSKLGIVLGE